MRQNSLLLITNSFPYGPGEQFLETEVKYLALAYETVIIIPMTIGENKRKVPENVKIINNHMYARYNKFYALKYAVWSRLFWHEIVYRPSVLKRLSSIKLLIGSIGLAKMVFKEVHAELINQVAADFKGLTIYSYWLRPSAILGCMLKEKYNTVKLVSRAHGGDLYEDRRSDNYLTLRKYLFSNIDLICPISKNGAAYLEVKYNLPASKISIFKLGVDDPKFTTKMSTIPNVFQLVSCSFLSPVKRLDLIIQSLSKFGHLNENCMVYWNHLGGGPDKKRLRGLTDKLPRNIRSRFWGSLPNKEILNYYSKNEVDLFINVSSSEGIPVSIMEAQSFGIIVAATNVGGVSEIVSNKNGFLLSSTPSIEEICEVFKEVATGSKASREKKVASKMNWQKHYYAAHNYNSFINQALR
jgi:glycosyltransferase involved in cell wall biosynthesis